jgi:V/A-type H+-transporting ATPase subunit A
MMQLILKLYDLSLGCIERGVALSEVTDLGLFAEVTAVKYNIPNDHLEQFAALEQRLTDALSALR